MSADARSLDDVVAKFLRRHPDFLSGHPDLLERLELQYDSGAATSLVQRQVKQLRRKNQELNRQLTRLMHVASENEQLMSRLHQLTLELMSIYDPAAFFRHLGQSLLNDFKADILRIYLFEGEVFDGAVEELRWIDRADERLQPFQAWLDSGHTVCGRLGESRLAFLFEGKARWVQSASLVPLGQKAVHGMMAIGSSDPARFFPGMGTLFLDRLAAVICSSLANTRPKARRRTA